MMWPTWWANVFAALLFVAIGLLVWRVPLRMLNADAPDGAKWRDIRYWATALVILQLVIYYLFR